MLLLVFLVCSKSNHNIFQELIGLLLVVEDVLSPSIVVLPSTVAPMELREGLSHLLEDPHDVALAIAPRRHRVTCITDTEVVQTL